MQLAIQEAIRKVSDSRQWQPAPKPSAPSAESARVAPARARPAVWIPGRKRLSVAKSAPLLKG